MSDFTELDLVDPATYLTHDMDEMWRQARQLPGVYWHEGANSRPGFWVVSRHADCQRVYHDSASFTAERGNMLSTLLAGGDRAGGRMVSVTEGERHRDLKKAILGAVSQKALARIVQGINDITHTLLTEALECDSWDFAARYASTVPINTICDLLGVPAADREYLLSLNKRAVSSEDEYEDEADSRMARNEIVMYLMDLVISKKGSPGDDVIAMLANTPIQGEPLSPEDIVANCYSLLLGGDETTRLSMITIVHQLASDEGLWNKLADPDLDLRLATEEVIRYASPIMHVGRTALADVEIAGTPIHTGDIVTVWNSSANRDPEVFDNPAVLDFGRNPNKHLALGFGTHFCVGVHLGRAEISALLRSLPRLFQGVELSGPVKPIYSNVLQGLSSLPVTFTARSTGGG